MAVKVQRRRSPFGASWMHCVMGSSCCECVYIRWAAYLRLSPRGFGRLLAVGVSSRLLLPVSGGAVNSESAGFEEDCRLWAVPLASRCRTSAAPNSQGRGQLREDMGEFSASFMTHVHAALPAECDMGSGKLCSQTRHLLAHYPKRRAVRSRAFPCLCLCAWDNP